MRYIRKIPPTDKEASEKLIQDGWKRLKEPASLGVATVYSLPFAISALVMELVLIYYLYAPFRELLGRTGAFLFEIQINIATLLYLPLIIAFLLLHEWVHASFIPGFLHSQKTYWGFNGVFGFVYTEEIVEKNTFLIICVMPYLALSIVLPVVLSTLGLLTSFVCLLCVLNACGSCVDMLNFYLIATRVPKGASIVSSGFETYFK